MIQGGDSRGGNVVLFMARQKFDQAAGKWSRQGFLASIDATGKQAAEYSTKENTINMASAEMNDASWDTFERRWEVGPDGKVYACNSYDNYEVTVYDKSGKVEKVVTRDYKHVPRTAQEKDFMNRMFSHWAKMIPNCKVVINPMDKDIENIYVRDDGSMWVLSSAGARNLPKGTLGTFDVFNPAGSVRQAGDPAGPGRSARGPVRVREGSSVRGDELLAGGHVGAGRRRSLRRNRGTGTDGGHLLQARGRRHRGPLGDSLRRRDTLRFRPSCANDAGGSRTRAGAGVAPNHQEERRPVNLRILFRRDRWCRAFPRLASCGKKGNTQGAADSTATDSTSLAEAKGSMESDGENYGAGRRDRRVGHFGRPSPARSAR